MSEVEEFEVLGTVEEVPILQVEEETGNGSVYTSDAAESIVEQINNDPVIGTPSLSEEFDADSQSLDRENASHVATNAVIEDDKVKVDIQLFDNEYGRELQSKLDEGVFRTSCVANPEEEDGSYIIGDDVEITSCSFVPHENDPLDL